MTKNKVIHARIDDNTYELLFEKCNELGCSITDYIQSVIQASLEDQESSNKEPESEEFVIKDVPELLKPTVEIIYD